MLNIQEAFVHENGNGAANKASKVRRLPLSQRLDNIVFVSKTAANSTLKQNKPISSLKVRKSSNQKLPTSDESRENIEDLPIHISKGSAHNTKSKILPGEESSSAPFKAELSYNVRPPIFRDMSDIDDRDDMLVLKRANPIYESEDEEEFGGLHLKKRRTSTKPMTLYSGEQLTDGFSLMGFFRE